MDCQKTEEIIISFIRDEVRSAGLENAVVGLSGGIDSSVVATLAIKALGKDHVYALIMPSKTSSAQNIEDARQLAESSAVASHVFDLTEMADAYFKYFPNADPIRKGNMMARLRMALLYDQAALHKALVMGTGNKTEIFLGYFTKYGDGGVDIEPIGDLYKKEVKELAGFLNLPRKIIEKKPTADLWVGQTDEGELGLSYNSADAILSFLVDKKYEPQKILSLGYNTEEIERVTSMLTRSEHKRIIPKIPKIVR
ncbi:MAG: NAD+ synthase [bacterium]